MNTIYAIIEGYYSDWMVLGYFTNREDAEKYCLKENKKHNYRFNEVYIEEINCLQDKEELPNFKVCYEFIISFRKNFSKNNWDIIPSEHAPEYYEGPLNPHSMEFSPGFRDPIITFCINITKNDKFRAENIAQNLMATYLYECNGKPSASTAKHFNLMLKGEE